MDLLGPHGEGALGARDRLRRLAREQVGRPHESGHERRLRILVHLGRRADLFDAAAVEDGQAVGQGQRLVLVVGHEDERDADVLLDRLELDLHLLAELQVEGAQRLVEQEQLRPVHERAREGDPLALAAGELARLSRLEARQAHELERLRDPGLPLAPAHLPHHEPVPDVVADGHVRKEGVVLEDGVHVALVGRQARHVDAVQQHLALGRELEPGDHPQGRGLPGARRAEHGEELAVSDIEADSVDGDDVAVGFPDAAEADRRSAGWLRLLLLQATPRAGRGRPQGPRRARRSAPGCGSRCRRSRSSG